MMSKDLTKSSEAKLQQEELRRRMLARLSPSGLGATVKDVGEYPSNVCLLLDRTGSMCLHVGDAGKMVPAIDELRRLAGMFPGVRKFQYSDKIQELKPGEEIGNPSGGNNEPLAFTTLKTLGIKEVVLITDGHPDDEEASLKAAVGLKISVCYIGPPPPSSFLLRLCKMTGGTYETCSLTSLKKLESTVKERLALAAPKMEGGPIQL
jgi:hypothetical protein